MRQCLTSHILKRQKDIAKKRNIESLRSPSFPLATKHYGEPLCLGLTNLFPFNLLSVRLLISMLTSLNSEQLMFFILHILGFSKDQGFCLFYLKIAEKTV